LDTAATPPLDLDAYRERIGYAGPVRPTADALEGLHLAHATRVPFENLDIHLGRPIRTDLDSVQAKLVRGRRGGYCFEQNTLFAAVLERAGFRLTRLAARVRLGATRVLPRTHMLLRVEVEGRPWLADVGFGTVGPLLPLPIEPERVARQFAWAYRLLRDGGLWTLQARQGDGWLDLYAFTEEPQEPVDVEVANYYVSTHPDSRFVQTLTAQASTTEARFMLRNREFTVERGAGGSSRTVVDDEGLLRVLAESFGLAFPAGTRFRCLG
jgi:N-hydroxyarylamine O-acetyltransferase